MTVKQLIAALHNFPPEFNVFCAGRPDGRRIAPPAEVVINLYHPQQFVLIGDDEDDDSEFTDCVVIYPSTALE
jgi:hypothetical protein